MNITDLTLPDIKLITLAVHRDARGHFVETFREEWLPRLQGARFVQDNQSRSIAAGTLRGLHYQLPPSAQAKLVQVLSGRILDVAVDVRRGSPTFGRHVALELAADDGQMVYVPAGFAHGFMTLAPDTRVAYKVTATYDKAAERGIAWDDPDLGIAWPKLAASLSERDQSWPRLKNQRDLF